MNSRRGVTLLELLLSILLMSGVFLAVSTLFATSRIFYFASEDDTLISYELQYAINHIYKYAIQGIGDGNNPGVTTGGVAIGSGWSELTVRLIDKLAPTDVPPPTYGDYSDDRYVRYQIDLANNKLRFDGNNDGDFVDAEDEDLASNIDIIGGSKFSLNGNLLIVELEGSHGGKTQSLYSTCYPRMASF